ncbi:MAG: hypothetical protein A2660_01895 [Candidatus Doudnabacteria bacterium RIFCSPHIGHO2_01_FULL_45_18]|uniref:Thioredoxin domain-containing protein n=1 Tax=Candidatus Doudnabacteria bacterium RIFCSPHIGHO2_01_FULL_45_18 TaxID=1817823 RepID=A0A1F5NRU3_9BACT|nr:MAG: hypothetical protein A2660_01895 [Candidatus Doudnabacteria bacterium RIFCSPHIGHO2_01_FULL_45_18]
MNKQPLVLFGIVVAVLALGVILFKTSDKPLEQVLSGSNIVGEQLVVRDQSHRIGNPEAKVTLVEFADFQCPACGAAYPQLKQIKEQYQDNLNFTFVYRNFPLIPNHKNAMIAASAAEAAGLQGKFWEMHDLLFENQTVWSSDINPTDTYVSFAAQVGLNTEQFKSDLSSQGIVDIVTQDLRDAEVLGLNSTPTFFLNGEKIKGLPSDLKGLIDQAMAN